MEAVTAVCTCSWLVKLPETQWTVSRGSVRLCSSAQALQGMGAVPGHHSRLCMEQTNTRSVPQLGLTACCALLCSAGGETRTLLWITCAHGCFQCCSVLLFIDRYGFTFLGLENDFMKIRNQKNETEM